MNWSIAIKRTERGPWEPLHARAATDLALWTWFARWRRYHGVVDYYAAMASQEAA